VNEFKAQAMVVGCLASAGAIAVGNDIVAGHPPSFRQLAGFTFTALGLATAAIPAPEVAAGFAVLILTSALFVYASPVLDAVSSFTATSSSTTPAPSGPLNT
jgi:hypothetical protein